MNRIEPLATWHAIAERSAVQVRDGQKYLMVSEADCIALGGALEIANAAQALLSMAAGLQSVPPNHYLSDTLRAAWDAGFHGLALSIYETPAVRIAHNRGAEARARVNSMQRTKGKN